MSDEEDGDVEEVAAVKDEGDGGHLGGGFPFSDGGDIDFLALSDIGHPFAEGGDADFAADDDGGGDDLREVCALVGGEEEEGDGDEDFVGDGVQEGAESAVAPELPGDEAVEEVGERGGEEDGGCEDVARAAGGA